MNVFLVDDDLLIREDIKAFYPWEREGFHIIGEAPNANAAIAWLERNTVDIVITDIAMPNGNGIDLIRWLKTHQFHGEIIVMSNYDDFDYVKDAMKLGAFDYCLKYKLSPESLLMLLKTAAESIREKEKRTAYIGISHIQLLKSCIRGKYSEAEQLVFVQKGLLRNKYIIQYIKFRENTDPAVSSSLHDQEWDSKTVWLRLDDHAGVILYSGETDVERLSVVPKFSDQLFRRIPNIYVIVYEPHAVSLLSLRAKISEMQSTALSFFYNEIPVICNQPTVQFAALSDKTQKRSFELALVHSAEIFDRIGFETSANEAIGFFEAKRVHPRAVCTFFESVLLLICQKTEAVDCLPAINYDEISSARVLRSILNEWCDGYFLIPLHTSKTEIMNAIHYIHSNYMKEISLEAIAQVAYMSKNHFCTLFRKETGDNFVVYLQKLRIEKAKFFLRSSQYRVQEIAEKVGIDNYRYFSTLFHKYTGMSPTQYRESLQ